MTPHDCRISVRYAETDAMGIVHHANYFIWFEVGRTEWLAARGYSYAQLEQSGYYLVVAEISARYGQPARYGHDIILRTHASSIKSRAIGFDYEVLHAETGSPLVTGHSRHILTDHEGRVRTFPPHVLELIKKV